MWRLEFDLINSGVKNCSGIFGSGRAFLNQKGAQIVRFTSFLNRFDLGIVISYYLIILNYQHSPLVFLNEAVLMIQVILKLFF